MKYRTVATIPRQRFYDVFETTDKLNGAACVSVIEDTAEVRVHYGYTLRAAMPNLPCDLDHAAIRCVEAMRSPKYECEHWTSTMWRDLAVHGISPAPTKAIATATAEDAYLSQAKLF